MTRVIGSLPQKHYEDVAAIEEALNTNVLPALDKIGISDRPLFSLEKIQRLLPIIERFISPSGLPSDAMAYQELKGILNMGYPKGEPPASDFDIVAAMILKGFSLNVEGNLTQWHFAARLVPC